MENWVKEREEKRSEMIYYGLNYGFNHEKTVKLSQELDEILNKEKDIKVGGDGIVYNRWNKSDETGGEERNPSITRKTSKEKIIE